MGARPSHRPGRPDALPAGPGGPASAASRRNKGAEPNCIPCVQSMKKTGGHLWSESVAGFLPRAGLGGLEKRFSKSIILVRARQLPRNRYGVRRAPHTTRRPPRTTGRTPRSCAFPSPALRTPALAPSPPALRRRRRRLLGRLRVCFSTRYLKYLVEF